MGWLTAVQAWKAREIKQGETVHAWRLCFSDPLRSITSSNNVKNTSITSSRNAKNTTIISSDNVKNTGITSSDCEKILVLHHLTM